MHKSKHSKFFTTFQINQEDSELFRSSVDNSRIFDKDQFNQDSNSSLKFPKFLNYSIIQHAKFGVNEVLFYNAGTHKNIINKIKQGNVPLFASIDLHGLNLEEVCTHLTNFIYHNQSADYLHIIHGKGYNSNMLSVLKTQTYYYLKSHPQVIAMCSAPEHLGGTGAVIIKLKHA